MQLGPDAGEEPRDTRSDLAGTVLEALREANESGELARFREQFPPAYFPFRDRLEEGGQAMEPLLLLDNGQILVRASDEAGRIVTYLIENLHVQTLPGVLTFGRSPDRRYFAIARESGITIHRGWDGPVVSTLDWPTPPPRTRDLLREFPELTVFPDGRRVLLGNCDAIMVLEQGRSTILFPRQDDEVRFPSDEDIFDGWLNNPHGEVSPSGSLISIGDRLTHTHRILNDRYKLVGKIPGLWDEAPCHASFSNDGRWLALSSFMLNDGATVLVPTRRFPRLVVTREDLDRCWHSQAKWQEKRRGLHDFDKELVVLDCQEVVRVSAWRTGELIIGDARGTLWAFDLKGEKRWHHRIGSACCGIDISADGRRLVASTYAGFVVILDLDTGDADPYRIGTSTHREWRRWLFWTTENKPLAW